METEKYIKKLRLDIKLLQVKLEAAELKKSFQHEISKSTDEEIISDKNRSIDKINVLLAI